MTVLVHSVLCEPDPPIRFHDTTGPRYPTRLVKPPAHVTACPRSQHVLRRSLNLQRRKPCVRSERLPGARRVFPASASGYEEENPMAFRSVLLAGALALAIPAQAR